MLGEIALYSFIILLLTGIYPDALLRPLDGGGRLRRRYTPLRGMPMSRAYASTLDISFDVRGGLIMRQIHHWAALLFMAAMMVHMFRVFFTGAFRKPRELNWIIGVAADPLGHRSRASPATRCPTTLLSGTGLRIDQRDHAVDPGDRHLDGSSRSSAASSPATVIIPRLYIVHVLLRPGHPAGA